MSVLRNDFGRANSVFRRDRNLKLRQVAEYLGVTPAFLSSVEVGRKAIPSEWNEKLVALYKLDKLQAAILKKACAVSQKRFVIEPERPKEAELLAAFVENRESLSDEQLELAIEELAGPKNEELNVEQLEKN